MNRQNYRQAVLIAITDPTLHPEASHVAAATGREVIATTDPREIARHAAKAAAVLVDATTAGHVASVNANTIVLLANDPGPVDWQLAMNIHAEAAMLLPAQAPELLALLGRDDPTPPSDYALIAVCGTAGGAGTTTLAASIAMSLEDACFVDADPYSAGADLVFGVESEPGLRWNDLGNDTQALPAEALQKALIQGPEGVSVLSNSRSGAPPQGQQLAGVLGSLRGASHVVVDCRIGTELATIARDHADACVLLIPAEIRGAACAARVQEECHNARVRTVGVLRHRGWSGIDAEEAATIAGVEIVAEIPTIRGLAKRMELAGLHGPPKPLQRVASSIVHALAHAGGSYE
ncbi:septum site-determining protein Ssd [Corynebacterium pseudopelargi]|uniref:Rv3660c-like CheY-like N-terminal domain-containing protein n=1 Tax=Corynebacterium pseudopelargi TaxID=2080757 RepID=A0A3G6IX79_9CORY|nr:septum site-determining protein Ssd [Corynebacterium pseudopelargi]AZA10173.1 hypothetical protein CPPEL_10375 [Corynebacterium pseudopelargi]